jgi:CubicO group peptidase (beta-lactamase class C family)
MAAGTRRSGGRPWQFARGLVLLAIVLIGASAAANELDRYIDQERKLYGLPAVVVSVLRDGRPIDTRARGLANVERGVKATARQVFEIGSISKQFTAYAVLIQPNTRRGLGDIATTVADLARWGQEQLVPRLVSPATAALARRPVLLNDGKPEPYGYGWSTERLLPMPTLSHEGQRAGFSATCAGAHHRQRSHRRVAAANQTGSCEMRPAIRAGTRGPRHGDRAAASRPGSSPA